MNEENCSALRYSSNPTNKSCWRWNFCSQSLNTVIKMRVARNERENFEIRILKCAYMCFYIDFRLEVVAWMHIPKGNENLASSNLFKLYCILF